MFGSIIDDDHLMVSFIDQRVAIDAVARLVQDGPPTADLTLFPFDGRWAGTPGPPIIGYSVPPALPV